MNFSFSKFEYLKRNYTLLPSEIQSQFNFEIGIFTLELNLSATTQTA